jgi:hypothetical protein
MCSNQDNFCTPWQVCKSMPYTRVVGIHYAIELRTIEVVTSIGTGSTTVQKYCRRTRTNWKPVNTGTGIWVPVGYLLEEYIVQVGFLPECHTSTGVPCFVQP